MTFAHAGGGEEFLILFAYCDLANAALLAERIRQAIAAIDTIDLHADLTLTASIGFTEFRAGEHVDAALKRADDALYEAKASGRDRVVGNS
jgi:diguanylate cyclase